MFAVGPKGKRKSGYSLAEFLPHAFEVASDALLLKDGGFLFGFEVAAPDFISLSPARRDQLSIMLARALCELGDGWSLWYDYYQTEATPCPAARFPTKELDGMYASRVAAYAEPFAALSNETLLFLRWAPPRDAEGKLLAILARLAAGGQKKSDPIGTVERSLAHRREELQRFVDYCDSSVRLTALSGDGRFSPLLTAVGRAITNRDEPKPHYPYGYYSDVLLAEEVWMGATPNVAGEFVGILSIDGFPPSTEPALLSALCAIPIPFRWTSRFILLSGEKAKATLLRERKRWQQASRSFVDQYLGQYKNDARWREGQGHVADIDDALVELSEESLRYGYYSGTIAVRHEDETVVREAIGAIRGDIARLGCSAREESINAFEAWLGSIPGVLTANVRRPLIHSLHYLNLLPISSSWNGSATNPSPMIGGGKADSLLRVNGRGNEMFDLNLHASDVGHTLIFGATGSGKSTLLAALAYAFTRYEDARIISFDRGQSLRTLTLAAKGSWLELAADNERGFNPLRMLAADNEPLGLNDRAFLSEWIADIHRLRSNRQPTASEMARIEDAVAIVAEPTEGGRSMLALQAQIQDENVRESLSAYAGDGAYAALYDDPEATNEGSPSGFWTCYETDTLMGMDAKASAPLMLLLFHLIGRSADGSPTLLMLDEAWAMLSHELFSEKIRDWLKTMRKKNVAVVLATQSLADAVRSGMLDVLAESCPTRIFAANPEADSAARAPYEQLGLPEGDIEIVANLRPKREYYLTVGRNRKIINLKLTPSELKFCGASGAREVSRAASLAAADPDGWAERWEKDEIGRTPQGERP